jgi:membrane-bound ClpP family serine protease
MKTPKSTPSWANWLSDAAMLSFAYLAIGSTLAAITVDNASTGDKLAQGGIALTLFFGALGIFHTVWWFALMVVAMGALLLKAYPEERESWRKHEEEASPYF